MDYAFSASENAFYAKALIDDYIDAGSWPDDAIDVENRIYLEYSGEAPEGKLRTVDSDGMPAWADILVDYTAKAESERQRLLKIAKDTISIWQTQLSLGSITDANKASLVKWLTYIEELSALNLSCVEGEQAYNGIEWPEIPSKESSN